MEFQSEIRTLARVEHLNLVRFYGYLEHGDERIVIVEYVPNGTLREHLDCEFLFTIFFIVVLAAAFITISLSRVGSFNEIECQDLCNLVINMSSAVRNKEYCSKIEVLPLWTCQCASGPLESFLK